MPARNAMTGPELATALTRLNLTRDQFASKVGKTRRTVQRWLLLDSVPELVADKVRAMMESAA